jgi:hypothetical protein
MGDGQFDHITKPKKENPGREAPKKSENAKM